MNGAERGQAVTLRAETSSNADDSTPSDSAAPAWAPDAYPKTPAAGPRSPLHTRERPAPCGQSPRGRRLLPSQVCTPPASKPATVLIAAGGLPASPALVPRLPCSRHFPGAPEPAAGPFCLPVPLQSVLHPAAGVTLLNAVRSEEDACPSGGEPASLLWPCWILAGPGPGPAHSRPRPFLSPPCWGSSPDVPFLLPCLLKYQLLSEDPGGSSSPQSPSPCLASRWALAPHSMSYPFISSLLLPIQSCAGPATRTPGLPPGVCSLEPRTCPGNPGGCLLRVSGRRGRKLPLTRLPSRPSQGPCLGSLVLSQR